MNARGTIARLAALAAGAALIALVACGGAVDDDSSNAAVTADASGPKALASSDFPAALDEAAIRPTNPELTDAAFAIKWTASKTDAFHFLRSFPPAFHADLAHVAPSRVPGGQALCLGDAHPENFGWMTEEGATFFGANDFDDSGYCPVAFDAARFFAAVALDFSDAGLTSDVLAQYVATVHDATNAVKADKKLAPSWTKVQATALARDTSDDAFVLGASTTLTAVDAATRSTLISWFAHAAALKDFALTDIAEYAHDSGGSAELPRYWLLVAPLGKDTGARTILEVKYQSKPGVEWGRHTKTLAFSTRFDTLTDAFWPARDAYDTFGVSLGAPIAGRYVVRDRLQRESLDFTKLSSKQTKNVLLAEASQLARVHAPGWAGVSQKEMTAWLSGTGNTLASRWQSAWKAAH